MAWWREHGPVLVVVALGGVIGACARYGAGLLWPDPPGAFPWTTLVVNASGCAALGAVMALWSERPLLRPFAGTGVLGGFTTFSAYTADVQRLVAGGRVAVGMAYLGLTVLAALACAWAAFAVTERVAR